MAVLAWRFFFRDKIIDQNPDIRLGNSPHSLHFPAAAGVDAGHEP